MEGSNTPDTPKLPASVFYTESAIIEIKLKILTYVMCLWMT